MNIRRLRPHDRLLLGLGLLGLLGLSGGAFLRASGDLEPAYNRLSAYPDRVVLTWSDDPATTQSVTWRTDISVAQGLAQYAVASPGPDFVDHAVTMQAESSVFDPVEIPEAGGLARFHSVTFTGLVPDTTYAYRVGDGERWSEWFHFRTASVEPEPFSFIYFGDAQNDVLSLWSRTIRSSFAEAPDARFMIHAGDLINRAHNDSEWGEWFEAGGWIFGMVPSIPATGNHEYRATNEAEDSAGIRRRSVFWTPTFTLPTNGIPGLEESNYYLDYQNLRVIVLDSNTKRQEQAEWLDRVLSETTQPWTVVTFHHPVFSTAGDRDNPEIRALWKPILDKHEVDLVLQGHDHTYGRGRTFRQEENAFTGANTRDRETGTVYVVSVSGPKMYEFKQEQWNLYPVTLDRRAENTQLFQVIRIDGDRLEYRAHTAVGDLYDAFELVRDGDGNRFVERVPDSSIRTWADTLTN